MTTMTRNKYRGTCSCGAFVEAGEGFYTFGRLTCEEPITEGQYFGCPTYVAQERLRFDRERERTAGRLDRTFVSKYSDVQEWLVGFWAKRDEKENDPEYQAQQKTIAEKRSKEDARWAKQGLRRCDRCGGAGRSDRWIATGSVCYQCEGHGAVIA